MKSFGEQLAKHNHKTSNPFYHNYLFSEADTKRFTFPKRDMIWLWLFPTFVQCDDGYAFYYKNVNGKIYVMKFEELPSRKSL